MLMASCISFFFFFQAEDGIRDGHVTGVQTCALPISEKNGLISTVVVEIELDGSTTTTELGISPRDNEVQVARPRSEERRVGKECRSRWSTDQEKEKKRKIKIETHSEEKQTSRANEET